MNKDSLGVPSTVCVRKEDAGDDAVSAEAIAEEGVQAVPLHAQQ